MAKRSNGEGSIFKRTDGRWCATYYVGSKRKFLYGKTQKAVKDKLKKLIEDSKDKADLVLSESTVLEAWVLEFLEQYKANDLKATTFTTYMTFYRKHIKGSMLGKMALQDITTMELQKFYNGKIADGLSAKTVRHLSVIIREALSQAVLLRYIKNNPHEGIVLPKKEKFVGKVLSKEDVIKLINEAKEERLYPLIMTTIMTGMRKGEVLGLTWKNVDLEQGYIKVEKSLCRVSGGRDDKGRERTKVVLLDPKNKTSKRTIPISTQLIDILKVHKENQDKAKNENKDIYNDELELVFANKLGGFMSDRNVLQEFYGVLDKYEIPRVRFHDLRHTYASLLMESETDSKVIQELLGHSSISTTLDIYTHLKLEQKRSSVDKMAELFSSTNKK